MASLAMAPEMLASSPFERRLREEWTLLGELAGRNPGRLTDLAAQDSTLCVTLRDTPARLAGGASLSRHRLRLEYPRFFPALPLELYLETPVFHPNVHPETGFVCLWDRHRAAHTAEDAVHKTAAMLGWRLFNLHAEHVMQPEAAALERTSRAQLAGDLLAAPLLGVRGFVPEPAETAARPRKRLS